MKDNFLWILLSAYLASFCVDLIFPLEDRVIVIPVWRVYLRYFHILIILGSIPILLQSFFKGYHSRLSWLVIGFYSFYILSLLVNEYIDLAEVLRKLELLQIFFIFIKILKKRSIGVERWIHVLWIVLVLISISSLYALSDAKVYGNSIGYLLCYFIPYWSYEKRYTLLSLTLVCIVICLKRGPIVIALISSLIFGRHLIRHYVISFVAILFYIRFNSNISRLLFGVWESRVADLSGPAENIGSGRGKAYSIVWEKISGGDQLTANIFGRGYGSAQSLLEREIGSRLRVHSDFLELFYDYGLVFIFFVVSLFWEVIRKYGRSNQVIFLLFVFFIQSAVSFSFTSNYFIFWLFIILILVQRDEAFRQISSS